MARVLASSFAVLLAVLGCSAPSQPTTVRVILTSSSERLVVKAEVAATPEGRARGLMFRKDVPEGSGMLFVFPKPVTNGFHMKNTLVDLHILFIRNGRVVEIRNMRRCEADPCPVTRPSQAYDSALELGLGTLGSLQVGADVQVFGQLPVAS